MLNKTATRELGRHSGESTVVSSGSFAKKKKTFLVNQSINPINQ